MHEEARRPVGSTQDFTLSQCLLESMAGYSWGGAVRLEQREFSGIRRLYISGAGCMVPGLHLGASDVAEPFHAYKTLRPQNFLTLASPIALKPSSFKLDNLSTF